MATGKSVNVIDAFHLVALRVASATGNRVDIKQVPWPDSTDPIDRRDYAANIDSISVVLDWRPLMDLEGGIDCMIDNIRKSNNKN